MLRTLSGVAVLQFHLSIIFQRAHYIQKGNRYFNQLQKRTIRVFTPQAYIKGLKPVHVSLDSLGVMSVSLST